MRNQIKLSPKIVEIFENIYPQIISPNFVNSWLALMLQFIAIILADGSNSRRNLIKFNQSVELSRRHRHRTHLHSKYTLTYTLNTLTYTHPHSRVICTEISDTLGCSTGAKKPQTNSPIDCLHLRFISLSLSHTLSFSLCSPFRHTQFPNHSGRTNAIHFRVN